MGETCGSIINKNSGAGRILSFLRKGPWQCIFNLSENDDAKPVKDCFWSYRRGSDGPGLHMKNDSFFSETNSEASPYCRAAVVLQSQF